MSQTTPPLPAAVRKLPVLAALSEAYAVVFTRIGLLLRAIVLPFLVSMLLVALSLYVQLNMRPTAISILAILLAVLGFVPYTIFGVSWHRLTLLGPGTARPPLFPGWRHRHWRFLGYGIGISLIVVIFGTFVAGAGTALAMLFGGGPELPGGTVLLIITSVVAVLILVLYLLLRLSFVFPAVAVDEAYRLKHSWAHTHKQGFRLMGALILTCIPIVIAILVIQFIAGFASLPQAVTAPDLESLPAHEAARQFLEKNAVFFIVFEVFGIIANYLFMALVVSLVSIAFRICTGWVPALAGVPASNGEER